MTFQDSGWRPLPTRRPRPGQGRSQSALGVAPKDARPTAHILPRPTHTAVGTTWQDRNRLSAFPGRRFMPRTTAPSRRTS